MIKFQKLCDDLQRLNSLLPTVALWEPTTSQEIGIVSGNLDATQQGIYNIKLQNRNKNPLIN